MKRNIRQIPHYKDYLISYAYQDQFYNTGASSVIMPLNTFNRKKYGYVVEEIKKGMNLSQVCITGVIKLTI